MTHDLDSLLRQADPAPTLPGHPDSVTALSAALAREVVEADRVSRGRRLGVLRRHKWAAAATAALFVVPTTAYAASSFLARTGSFGDPVRNAGLADSSEYIDLCAPDIAAYVASVAPTDLPAPPGHSWSSYASPVAKGQGACDGATKALTQASSIEGDYLMRALSDWSCTLVWAHQDGDDATERDARAAITTLDDRARRLNPTAVYDPDTVIANSELPQWVGCPR